MYILSLKVCQQEFGQRILSVFWSFIVGFKKNHIKICVFLPSQKLSGLKDKEGNYKKYFQSPQRKNTPWKQNMQYIFRNHFHHGKSKSTLDQFHANN